MVGLERMATGSVVSALPYRATQVYYHNSFQQVKYLQLHIFMAILKRFRKLRYRKKHETADGRKYCVFYGTFLRDNALVIVYGKYVMFKIERA